MAKHKKWNQSRPKNNTQKKTEPKKSRLDKKMVIIMSISFIIFLSLSIVSNIGIFDRTYNTIIDFEKKYFASYSDIPPPKVLMPGESTILAKRGFGEITLVGYVDFQSSSFSAQTPIHVEIEMYHTQYGEELDEDFWNALPKTFFAYFPKAKYITNTNDPFENEKSVIIPLEKHDDPPRIKGNGDFKYPREGNFEFLIFDPYNIPDFDNLRTTLEMTYDLSNGHLKETSSKYDSTISISTADSYDSIISSRNNLTFSFLGVAFALPPIIFAVRNYVLIPKSS